MPGVYLVVIACKMKESVDEEACGMFVGLSRYCIGAAFRRNLCINPVGIDYHVTKEKAAFFWEFSHRIIHGE